MPLQDSVTETLRAMRFALVGFDSSEESRLRSVLDLAGARANAIGNIAIDLRLSSLAMFDACVINVSAGKWNGHESIRDNLIGRKGNVALLIGNTGEMRRHALVIASPTQEFVIRPWSDEEIVLRAFNILRSAEAGRREDRPAEEIREVPVVVLADDDKATELLVCSMLRANGMQCNVAADGKRAFKLVRDLKPDVLMLDVSMPVMDGFEVLGAIKHDPSTMKVPVVMLTASGSEDDVARGFSLGAEDYITKPFHPHEMIARIKMLLRRRGALA